MRQKISRMHPSKLNICTIDANDTNLAEHGFICPLNPY